ncbi:class I SAM-dependent methyltransferase [Shewanella maritima]|uniref:class I SAM-dependent methyltransferase n=1 Tax=Shewanella maritima TaxID=2520507 RepID=UPI00373705B1
MSVCPLCHSPDLVLFHQDKKREYLRCNVCQLVTVPAQYYLSQEDEKAFYDLHDNTVADEGYQRFLGRTLFPLLPLLSKDAAGLDYGCGEGAVLSQMAEKHGIKVDNYDLFYHPHSQLLDKQYDFITMTEVIEHIADAQGLMQQFEAMLKPGGTLAIMTKRVLSHEAFIDWHYKHDPTHINFYSEATFQWLAERYQWQLQIIDKDVVFLHRL